jgi:hypothetical protein
LFCATSTSPLRSCTSAANCGRKSPFSRLQRLVVGFLVQQHAGQAQARDRLVLVVAVVDRPLQLGLGGLQVVGVEGALGGGQGAIWA